MADDLAALIREYGETCVRKARLEAQIDEMVRRLGGRSAPTDVLMARAPAVQERRISRPAPANNDKRHVRGQMRETFLEIVNEHGGQATRDQVVAGFKERAQLVSKEQLINLVNTLRRIGVLTRPDKKTGKRAHSGYQLTVAGAGVAKLNSSPSSMFERALQARGGA